MDWKAILDFFLKLGASLGTKLLAAGFVLFVGHKIIKKLKKHIRKPTKPDKSDLSVRLFIASFSGIALYVLLFITAAMILGIPTTSFITAIASCGVAIGLAMQGFLSNFAGGIMIMLFKPFTVGDYIETEEAAGTVSEITVVYTILKTPDNKVITVPNGNLTNSVIQNYSAVDRRRVDIVFNVAYDSDIEFVKRTILDVVEKHPEVLNDPKPMARLSAHGDSAMSFTARAWCKTDVYWDVKFDLMEEVKKVFDEKGIKIPYPQMDVHINSKENEKIKENEK